MSNPGAAGGSALARCIACGAGDFATEHWGRAPLLTRAAELGRDFSDLLSADAVDELVAERGLRTPFARMAKDGDVLPAGRFTRGGGVGASISDQLADDKVLAQIGDGATLVLQALHRTWPPVVRFAAALSDELGHPVQVNAYITPPQSQGFAPHYDVHDVFVLQVAGRKHWTIHEPVVIDPLSEQPWEGHRAAVTARAAETPLIDEILAPGDALYLPRGTIHAATALGETSIHLTVGIHPITRNTVLRQLTDLARDVVELRTSLPMGSDLADPDVLAPHAAATIDALRRMLDGLDPAALAERVGAELRRATRPEPLAPLAQLAALEAVQPQTPLRLRAGLHASLELEGAELRIRLLDRTVVVHGTSYDAVKVIMSGSVFVPAELPGLAPDAQVDVARRLLRGGIVLPA